MIRSLVGGSQVTDHIVTRLNTEDMTKAYYKAFPMVVTVEDGMRQALKSIAEIERLRRQIQLMAIDYRTQIHGLKSRCQCGAANG